MSDEEVEAVEEFYERELDAAKRDLEEARGMIRMALDELGVPGPGYPANVAAAVEILRDVLARTEKP